MRTERRVYLHIPVVDLHGYQMIYQSLGVLRETGYIDTWRTKKEGFYQYKKINKYQLKTLRHGRKSISAIIFYIVIQFSFSALLKSVIYCLNVCSAGGDTFLFQRKPFLYVGFDVRISFLTWQMYKAG